MYLLIALVFLTGLAVLAYPTFSDYWNSLHSTRAIMTYTETVAAMTEEDFSAFFRAAEAYNAGLLRRSNPFLLSEQEAEAYDTLLNIDGNGVMGYIEIPSISCDLPVYHGSDEAVLQTAIGHIEWTSLPVGGESTHAVLSGHRGLPSAKLFTDLDKLSVGDVFMLCVLNEVFTYEVDQILIVLPEDVSSLQVSSGADYCTLVTCTPYGINTHRLLVRGHRIENTPEVRSVRVTSEAIQVEPVIVAPFVAIPILTVFILILVLDDKSRRRGGGDVEF